MAFHLHYHCRKESAEKSDSRLIQVPLQRLLKKPPVKRSTRKVTSMNQRSTDQPFFYSGSVFTTLLVAVVTCVPASQAEAAGGFWQIEGQLINVDRSGINNISECEQRNTTLRFRSRWSAGQGSTPGTNGECRGECGGERPQPMPLVNSTRQAHFYSTFHANGMYKFNFELEQMNGKRSK